MSHIEVTVDTTGELLEFAASTPQEILDSWLVASSYIAAYEKVKDRLKKVIPEFIDERGQLEVGSHLFRISAIQRMNYDKFHLRQVFDEDTLDLFLEPNKGKIDKYIAANLAELGEGSTLLRTTMVPVGKPYSSIRVEKL